MSEEVKFSGSESYTINFHLGNENFGERHDYANLEKLKETLRKMIRMDAFYESPDRFTIRDCYGKTVADETLRLNEIQECPHCKSGNVICETCTKKFDECGCVDYCPVCTDCNLLLKDEDTCEECPVCGGWGLMSNEDPPPDEEICDYCQGSGAIPGSKAYEEHYYR